MNFKSFGSFLSNFTALSASIVGLVALQTVVNHQTSPSTIRRPELDHYHFRLQIIIDGKSENFAENKYQTPYDKNQCSIELPAQPIHFHDAKDQFVHIHWKGITGGLVLKNYGWNYIDGQSSILGHRYTGQFITAPVKTHGSVLPEITKDSKFWVYTGDEITYDSENFNDFINQDLEQFFGVYSNFMTSSTPSSSIGLNLFTRASAHGAIQDSHATEVETNSETEAQKLTRINNLIGNVVIFVQNDQPSNEQIKQRFNNLMPLSDSTCGG